MGVERDVLNLTGSVKEHSRVTAHLSAQALRNSEDFASHRDAKGNAQGAQKFRQPLLFAFLERKAQGSCTIGSDSFAVKQA